MNNRIYQLTKAPVPNNEWFNEDDIRETSFIGSVADCVYNQPSEERESNIGWFMRYREEVFARDGNKITVLPGAKHAYFKRRYEQFKKYAVQMTLDDFCDSYETWVLQEIIQNKYHIYIYRNGKWQSLDHFIRVVEEGSVFYIGGIVGYRC